MAAPFFQGNISDLLNVAGAGQGSYMLGQMLERQKQEEKAKIEQSILNNLKTRQETEQSAIEFPLKIDRLKAEIAKWEADAKHTGEQTRGLALDNDASATATPEQRFNLKNAPGRLANTQADKIQGDQYTSSVLSTEWSPNLRQQMIDMAKEHNQPYRIPDMALMDKKSWDAYRKAVWEGSETGRKTMEESARSAATNASHERIAKMNADAKVKAAKETLNKPPTSAPMAYIQFRAIALSQDPDIPANIKEEARIKAVLAWQAMGMAERVQIVRSQGANPLDLKALGVPTKDMPTESPMPPVDARAGGGAVGGGFQRNPGADLPPGTRNNGDGTFTLPDGRTIRPKAQ